MEPSPTPPRSLRSRESTDQLPHFPKPVQSLGETSGQKPVPFRARLGTRKGNQNAHLGWESGLDFQDSRSPPFHGGEEEREVAAGVPLPSFAGRGGERSKPVRGHGSGKTECDCPALKEEICRRIWPIAIGAGAWRRRSEGALRTETLPVALPPANEQSDNPADRTYPVSQKRGSTGGPGE